MTSSGQSKGAAVASNNLNPLGAFGNVGGVDLAGRALLGVEASIVLILRVGIRISIAQTTTPGRVAAESALIVDAPSEDFVVLGDSSNVHAAASDLDDAAEVVVDTGALDINGLLSVVLHAAETELAGGTLAEDEDVHHLRGRLVDHLAQRLLLGFRLGLGRSLGPLGRGLRGFIVGLNALYERARDLDLLLLFRGLLLFLFILVVALALGAGDAVLLVGILGGLRGSLLSSSSHLLGRSSLLGGSGLLSGSSGLLRRGGLLGGGGLGRDLGFLVVGVLLSDLRGRLLGDSCSSLHLLRCCLSSGRRVLLRGRRGSSLGRHDV